MIQIVPLKDADIDIVLTIEKRCFPNDPWPRISFEEELHNPLSRFFVLSDTETGAILGYGGVWLMYDAGNITNLAVCPDCRRRGLGKRLLTKLIDVCIEENMASITLEVRRSNAAARALYASMGFTVQGMRRQYYKDREDAVIMTKDLSR